MLLRCFLIHISIIIVRSSLYFLNLCLCLDLGLFILYYVIYFSFLPSRSYNLMNTETFILLLIFLEYVLESLDDNMTEECE